MKEEYVLFKRGEILQILHEINELEYSLRKILNAKKWSFKDTKYCEICVDSKTFTSSSNVLSILSKMSQTEVE